MKNLSRIFATLMTVALLLCAFVLVVSADEWETVSNENLAKTMGTVASDMNGFSVTVDVLNEQGQYPYSISFIMTNKPDNYNDIDEYILAIPGQFQGAVNEKCDARLGFLWDNYLYMEEYSFVVTLLDDMYTPQSTQGTAGDGIYDVVTYSVIRWGELEGTKFTAISVPADEPITFEPRYYFDWDEEANTLDITLNGETYICMGFSEHWTHREKFTFGFAAHALQDPDTYGIAGLEELVYTTDFEITDICGTTPEEFAGYTDTTCEHVWGEEEHLSDWPAVCSKKGKTICYCENCGWADQVFVAPLDHTWGELTVITPATCTTDGSAKRVCTVCTQEEIIVLPGGHTWGEWQIESEPSCGIEGVNIRTCEACLETETESLPALEHSWSEWEVTLEPTETEDGEKSRTCVNCASVESLILPATGSVFEPPYPIPEDQWYTDGVLFCLKNGLMAGVSDTDFGYTVKVSRAQFVTILAAINGADLTSYTEMSFTDVPAGQWYSAPIEWAAQNGYASGVGNGMFAKDADVTRETLAQFFYTYSKMNGVDVSAAADLGAYEDQDTVSTWAVDAVEWAVEKGLISGTSATTLSPASSATRAEIAVIVTKYVQNVLGEARGEVITPPLVYDTPAIG